MISLRSLCPHLAKQLSDALLYAGHKRLAESVGDLTVVRRCCKYSFCASFHTSDVSADTIANCGTRLVLPVPGLTCVFIVDDEIVTIELLNRNDIRAALDAAFP